MIIIHLDSSSLLVLISRKTTSCSDYSEGSLEALCFCFLFFLGAVGSLFSGIRLLVILFVIRLLLRLRHRAARGGARRGKREIVGSPPRNGSNGAPFWP